MSSRNFEASTPNTALRISIPICPVLIPSRFARSRFMLNTISGLLLSKSDIEYLQRVGFKQDNSKNSGLYYFEDDRKTNVLVPQEDGTYKLEFFEICNDGDGNYYEDFDKEYSNKGQTLQQFIEEWIYLNITE